MNTDISNQSDLIRLLTEVRDAGNHLSRLLLEASERQQQENEEWLDAQDVMQLLHIGPDTLRCLRRNGTLGYSHVGKHLYYRKSEIHALLHNNYVMYKLKSLGKTEVKELPSR